jgi:hypothetical protein
MYHRPKPPKKRPGVYIKKERIKVKKEVIKNTTVKVNNLFPNFIATKSLDLSKLKIVGKNFKKTFRV